jgi:hypothetical protein
VRTERAITVQVDDFMIRGVSQENQCRRNPYLIPRPTDCIHRTEAASDADRSECKFCWEPELLSFGFGETTFVVHLMDYRRGGTLPPNKKERWPVFTLRAGQLVAAVRADDRRVWLKFIEHSHARVSVRHRLTNLIPQPRETAERFAATPGQAAGS